MVRCGDILSIGEICKNNLCNIKEKMYLCYMNNTPFESLGFFKEIYINRKYIGCIPCETDPTRKIGYMGRKNEVMGEDMVINKTKIKKGSVVETIYYPLCGRIK